MKIAECGNPNTDFVITTLKVRNSFSYKFFFYQICTYPLILNLEFYRVSIQNLHHYDHKYYSWLGHIVFYTFIFLYNLLSPRVNVFYCCFLFLSMFSIAPSRTARGRASLLVTQILIKYNVVTGVTSQHLLMRNRLHILPKPKGRNVHTQRYKYQKTGMGAIFKSAT